MKPKEVFPIIVPVDFIYFHPMYATLFNKSIRGKMINKRTLYKLNIS